MKKVGLIAEQKMTSNNFEAAIGESILSEYNKTIHNITKFKPLVVHIHRKLQHNKTGISERIQNTKQKNETEPQVVSGLKSSQGFLSLKSPQETWA